METNSDNETPKASIDSNSQVQRDNEKSDARRYEQSEGTSIMKIIFTDRIYDQECTTPKSTPRQET